MRDEVSSRLTGQYPEDSYYAPRYEGYYAVGSGCYYDNGYDLRVHLICPRN